MASDKLEGASRDAVAKLRLDITPTPRSRGGWDDEAAYARRRRLSAVDRFTGDDHCDDVGALRCAALRHPRRGRYRRFRKIQSMHLLKQLGGASA